MPQYSDPLGMLPNLAAYQGNGGPMGVSPMNPLVVEQALQRESQAQPFIQQAQQTGAADTALHLMTTGEQMSPEAQQARMGGYAVTTAKNNAALQTIPWQTRQQIADYQSQIKAMPAVTDAKIAQANLVTQKAKGTPYMDFLGDVGSLYDQIHAQKDPDLKGVMYERAVQRWQLTHPGVQLPQEFRTWNPGMEGELGALRYSQMNDPDYIKKMNLAEIPAAAAVTSAKVHAGGQVQSAEIGAKASGYAADQATLRTGMTENPARAQVRLRRQIQGLPEGSPEREDANRELEGTIAPQFYSTYAKDPTALILASKAGSSPEAMKASQSYKQWQYMEFMHKNGVEYHLKGYHYIGGQPNLQSSWAKDK